MNTRTCSICEMGQLILHTEKITVEHLGQQGQIESQYSMCDYCNSEQAGADEARFNKVAINFFKNSLLRQFDAVVLKKV